MFKRQSGQPLIQPITGTFKCLVCGASTYVNNESNPAPICRYCGAPLPELKQLIDNRFAFIQEQYRSAENREKLQIEYKHQQKMLKQESAEQRRTMKIENQQKLIEAQINQQVEIEKIRAETLLKAQEQQEKIRKSNLKTELILSGIAILLYLIFFGKYIFK